MKTRISYSYKDFNVVGIKNRLDPEINSHTTEIRLHCDEIDVIGTRALMDIVVVAASNLATLDLWKNNIGPQGAEYVAEALQKGLPLLNLNLASNSLYTLGLSKFQTVLMHNNTLTSLCVGNNGLADAGMVMLSDVIKKNKTLTALFVDNNDISSVGADALFSALPLNKTLETLSLSNNPLGDGWTANVNQTLSKNSSLSRLYLAKCGITHDGVSQLSEAKHGILSGHPSLTTLDLMGNNITEKGANAIGLALENNVFIQNLYLSEYGKNNNKISEEITKKISSLLKRNQAIAESCQYPDVVSALRKIRVLTAERASTTVINDSFKSAIRVAKKRKSHSQFEFKPTEHLLERIKVMHKQFKSSAPMQHSHSMFRGIFKKVQPVLAKLLPAGNCPMDHQIESCLETFKQALIRRIKKDPEHQDAYNKVMFIVDNIIAYYQKKRHFSSLAFKPNHNISVEKYIRQLSCLMDAENPSREITDENLVNILEQWQCELSGSKRKDAMSCKNDGLFLCLEEIKLRFSDVIARLNELILKRK